MPCTWKPYTFTLSRAAQQLWSEWPDCFWRPTVLQDSSSFFRDQTGKLNNDVMGSTTLASSRSLTVVLDSAVPLSCNIILTYPLGGGWEGAEWPSSNPPAMLRENRPERAWPQHEGRGGSHVAAAEAVCQMLFPAGSLQGRTELHLYGLHS